MEEVKKSRKVPREMNSTFLVLIPKKGKLVSFDGCDLFFLCNYVSKIIAKIFAIKIERILSCYITRAIWVFSRETNL